MRSLIFAIPARGRMREQAEAFLRDCGLHIRSKGGERSYSAHLEGIEGIDLHLLRSGEIPASLRRGTCHIGLTGDDLIEESGGYDAGIHRVRRFDFGEARLVVAVPASWIDVATMTDLDEVAAHIDAGLRVATKYERLTGEFLASHGIGNFQIISSRGATEGAVASGLADVIADISTTGKTLAANGLKTLADGEILASKASLLASSRASLWDEGRLDVLDEFLARIDARVRALDRVVLRHDLADIGPDRVEESIGLVVLGPGEAYCSLSDSALAAAALLRAGARSVQMFRPEWVFDADDSDRALLRRILTGRE